MGMKKKLLMVGAVIAAGVLSACADEITARTEWLKSYSGAADEISVLRKGMESSDPEIQAKAVYEYFRLKGEDAYPELLKLANKSSDPLARVLICAAESFKDEKQKTELLSAVARGTYSQEAAQEANRKNFNFHRINQRLKDRKDWDFDIVTLKSIPIPQDSWKIFADTDTTGHLKGYYKEDFEDSGWKAGKIATLKNLPLVWYRIRFQAPEKPDCNAAELAFGGVEASAWVWLNGIYIGSRDEGHSAWDKPFALDITKEIRWGRENILVVRVGSTDVDSGIYKPVKLEILK